MGSLNKVLAAAADVCQLIIKPLQVVKLAKPHNDTLFFTCTDFIFKLSFLSLVTSAKVSLNKI